MHFGATRNDIVDTASAIQISQSLDIVEKDVIQLISTLSKLAEANRDTIMMGRTHGQFAIPTTYGFKIAGYITEMMRYQERISEARKRLCVGKMSGAIGTGAALGPKVLEIQELVMNDLGLGIEEQRPRSSAATGTPNWYRSWPCWTRHATLRTEVRNLQRSEIMEVSEAFDSKKQVGSSTMAQKRNPIISENLCGLTRIARAMIIPAMEDMVLWHERDLTNSSAERFILPHIMVLTDDIVTKMDTVFSGLVIHKDNMQRNLDSSRGLMMAEPVIICLVGKGLGRQDAHEIVRRASMAAEDQGKTLKEMLLKNKEVKSRITKAELDDVMDPANYVGVAPQIVDSVVAKAKSMTSHKKARRKKK